MIFKNYYKILGLTKNIKSTQYEIKCAYRDQAKKYHPDVNVNNKVAEERFKDINEAYRILSDPIQKKKYDRTWNTYVGKKLQKEKNAQKEVRVNDIVNMFFGGSIAKKEEKPDPLKGENIETQIDIPLKEAFDGTHKSVSIVSKDDKKTQTTIDVEIPKGVKQSQVIRIAGRGKLGKYGGKNGDMLIKINIKDNVNYKLKGDDIYVDLYVAPWDAALGTKMRVHGIDEELSILLPKGTQNGDRISIPNKGYYIDGEKRGNLVIETKIAIPKNLNEEEKNLLKKLKEISSFNPENSRVNIK